MPNATIAFGSFLESHRELSDAEFLTAISWNSHCPKPLAAAAAKGDVERFARLLVRRGGVIRDASVGKRQARLFAEQPSRWSRASLEPSPRFDRLFDAVDALKSARKADRDAEATPEVERPLLDWLADAGPAEPLQPAELLVLLELLPAFGRDLSPAACWEVWRTVLTAGVELAANLDSPVAGDLPPDRRIVLTGELPFELGVVFAGTSGSGKLRRRAGKTLARELLDATDNDGTPGAEQIERLPLWMAGFVRSRQWANAFGEKLWNDEAEERFLSLIRVAVSLCRLDGKLALSNGVPTETLPILRTAAGSGLRKSSRPRRLLDDVSRSFERRLSGKRPKPGKSSKRGSEKSGKEGARRAAGNRPAGQSDWAQLACLRSDWSADADLLVVAHDAKFPRIDLSARGVPMLHGDWLIDVTLDGEPLKSDGEWTCTCWFSDGDVDFVELQQKGEGGVLIDRQLALSRTSHFACLVDCVHNAPGKRISYQSRLAPADGAECRTDADSRELQIRREKTVVRCYPPALPCDRVHGTSGGFQFAGDDSLVLSQVGVGGLVAPLILDWAPHRRKAQAEWRTLTVAEDGRSLGSESAAGFRLRVGDLHLVLYRSLTPTVLGRSVLGLHTRNETVLGRFTAEGEVDAILLVE